jgi:cell wall-associated NlpC family hydrolase
MTPFELIGLPYRLGANPEQHKAADCLSLARCVLKHYNIDSPDPERDWYRRLRRKDYSIFEEQLTLWGDVVDSPKLGTVALIKADAGALALATYFAEQPGWISFVGTTVKWSPLDQLLVERFYCPMKSRSAKR